MLDAGSLVSGKAIYEKKKRAVDSLFWFSLELPHLKINHEQK